MFSVVRSPGRLVGTLAGVVGLAISAAGTAGAGPSPITQAIPISASVANNCKSDVTQPATIVYDPIGTNVTVAAQSSDGALLLNCTRGDAITIDMGPGSHATTGTPPERQMIGSGTNTYKLAYDIYSNSGFSTKWGTQTGGATIADTGKGPGGVNHQLTETLYISIPPGQDVPADTGYTDSVTATISY